MSDSRMAANMMELYGSPNAERQKFAGRDPIIQVLT
jgi:hypothetical protein